MDLRLALQDLIMEASPGDGDGDGDGSAPILLLQSAANSSPLIRFVDDHDRDRDDDPDPGLIDNASLASIAAEFEENAHEADRFVARVSSSDPILDDDDRQGEIPSSPSSSSPRLPSPSGDGGWIRVNVGGVRLITTAATLCVDSDSMLAAWVLRYRRSDESELRIDRDGDRFRHVLNYLRCGTLWLDDLPSLRAVYEEASFYQLKGLEALCQQRMAEAEARQAAESKRRKEEIEEALKAAFFSWERDRAYHYPPKGKNEVLAVLRGRRLGISEPPRFDMNADF